MLFFIGGALEGEDSGEVDADLVFSLPFNGGALGAFADSGGVS